MQSRSFLVLFSAFSVVKRVKISSGKNGFVFDYAGILCRMRSEGLIQYNKD